MEVMNGCCSFARCAGGRLVHLLSAGAFLQEREAGSCLGGGGFGGECSKLTDFVVFHKMKTGLRGVLLRVPASSRRCSSDG
jgi:hypothetical protein